MGLMTLQYVFHKGAVMVYAVLLLALNGRWLLAADAAGMMRYLLPACLMVAAIILALVLVCTSRTVQKAAYWALGRLPDTDKWRARRQSWTRQLDGLAAESRSLLADRKLCIQMFLLQVVKLALMYAIIWLGTAFMDLGPLTFWQAQTLAALMMLLSNALPNVGAWARWKPPSIWCSPAFWGRAAPCRCCCCTARPPITSPLRSAAWGSSSSKGGGPGANRPPHKTKRRAPGWSDRMTRFLFCRLGQAAQTKTA